MDSTTSSALAIGSIVLSVVGSVAALVNHKRVRSNCCGKELSASLDVENTTPVDPKKEAFDLEKKGDDKK
jgi:hypothetical protein